MKSGRGKVVVAMSGGVDSSLAAALLVERGYEVVGCFMRLGEVKSAGEASKRGCCSVEDARDAQQVAGVLGIPLYVLNFQAEFGRVLRYFVDEYNAGRTPNPCIRCNEWLKFGRLLAQAESLGARWLATGHYARVEHEPELRLLKGKDAAKDQSYVLFGIGREAMRRLVLPIGELEKAQVREMARQRGLPVHDKPDSQEICFVPDDDYYGLLKRTSPEALRPGEVVDREGRVVARHEGHQQFTIGQRRGLGFAAGQPRYVVDKDAATNRVVVGEREELLAGGLEAHEANWLIGAPPVEPRRCEVKIRSNAEPVAATLQPLAPGSFRVTFEKAQWAVAPGQAVVVYEGEEVLGGGWIRKTVRGSRDE